MVTRLYKVDLPWEPLILAGWSSSSSPEIAPEPIQPSAEASGADRMGSMPSPPETFFAQARRTLPARSEVSKRLKYLALTSDFAMVDCRFSYQSSRRRGSLATYRLATSSLKIDRKCSLRTKPAVMDGVAHLPKRTPKTFNPHKPKFSTQSSPLWA